MKSHYPFQIQYENHLINESLAKTTKTSYSQTVTNFFNYLIEFNPGFANNPTIENIFDRDITNYLSNQQTNQLITDGTYNKILSQLTHYFNFLFTHNLTTNLPTINIHGKSNPKLTTNSVKWLKLLPEILQDNQIHVYTKMTLLLSYYGYTVQEFMQPNFFQEFQKIKFDAEYQQVFIVEFNQFIKPIQLRQQTKDLFLKQRINLVEPRLTNAGLHKYLSKDELYLNLDLSPKRLHQSYILWKLSQLHNQSDSEIMTILKLDPSSLLYYKKLEFNTK